MPTSPLILASANPGKIREFRALLAGLPFSIATLAERGIASPPESGDTLSANALLKARHAASLACTAALADDSGLEVDALGGAPGVFSARYAGEPADDEANNAKLIAALAGVPAVRRTARYRCVLAFLADAAAPPLLAEGVWEGCIIEAPLGSAGFGYDPYFWIPQLGATAAQLEPAVKNRLSHRAQAARALRSQLAQHLGVP